MSRNLVVVIINSQMAFDGCLTIFYIMTICILLEVLNKTIIIYVTIFIMEGNKHDSKT